MNNYGSKLDTFHGYDLYNLPLPISPPAAFSPTGLTTRFLANRGASGGPVYGFNRSDRPYLRGLGMFCNLADGLVEANASHTDISGIVFKLRLYRFGNALTGTIANTAGSASVVGTGTLFVNELCVGMIIAWADAAGNVRQGTVSVITDSTHLTLSAATSNVGMFAGDDTVAGTVYPYLTDPTSLSLEIPTLNQIYPMDFFIGDVSKVRALRGTLTFREGSASVTGERTKFTVDVAAGQFLRFLDVNGVLRTVMVSSIQSDVALTLSAAAPGSGVFNADLATNPASIPSFLDSHLGVSVESYGAMTWGTISLDPSYAGQLCKFHAVANIEHSFDLEQVWG